MTRDTLMLIVEVDNRSIYLEIQINREKPTGSQLRVKACSTSLNDGRAEVAWGSDIRQPRVTSMKYELGDPSRFPENVRTPDNRRHGDMCSHVDMHGNRCVSTPEPDANGRCADHCTATDSGGSRCVLYGAHTEHMLAWSAGVPPWLDHEAPYSRPTCTLSPDIKAALLRSGERPCDGCNGDRAKCGGHPKTVRSSDT